MKMEEAEDHVIVRIKDMFGHLPSSTRPKPTIDRVDDWIRQVSERDYEPKSVSIGPIHRAKDHVQRMERHKVRYLKQLLERIGKSSLKKLVSELRNLEGKARLCYPTSMSLDEDEFVVLMLLDGCFVIELLRNYFFGNDDEIVQSNQTLYQIRHDLMLLENQLPFFVLNKLFNMTKTQNPDDNICHLVLFFVLDMFPWSDISKIYPKPEILENTDHLLGLVYHSCFSFSSKYFCEDSGRKQNDFVCISSASELKEAGIRLKGSKRIARWDISFANGVVKLPLLDISDRTESLLRNLMAYEQRFPDDHPKYVTDYAFLMQCLVRSTKDVEILRRNRIITNFLGSDDMVFDLINRLGKNVVISLDICYSDVVASVERHCRLRHRRWMAKLRKFLNTP